MTMLFISVKVNNYTVHGMLLEHLEDYAEPGVAERSTQECDEMIGENDSCFLLKDINQE